MYKISGALAESGASLNEVESIAQYVADNITTVGVATGHSHVPGTNSHSQDVLVSDEIEVGIGIHNEPGVLRLHGQGGGIPPISETM